jgi:hypothetical protein
LNLGWVYVGDLQGKQGDGSFTMTPLEQKYSVKKHILYVIEEHSLGVLDM